MEAKYKPPVNTASDKEITYTRFDFAQRLEHFIFLLSFSTLGFTGLIQKFVESPLCQSIIQGLGGIENVRTIHHYAAFVMMLVSVYHILELAYRVFVLRVPWTMMPLVEDARHLFQDIGYYLGLRKHKAYYGRYNYAEKAEYLAVVWGTIIMGITGFMMWNPIRTSQVLPGQVIPAAKAAHGAEAILAVLAILIWHFYFVHIKVFNKSMFSGKITRQEMKHEHPAELANIESGQVYKRPHARVLRKRQIIYTPFALIFVSLSAVGIYWWLTTEKTYSPATAPQGETVAIYVPVTPTPRPSPTPTPTVDPNAPVGEMTWEGYFQGLFDNRCGTCHSFTSVGGLTLKDYQSALQGGFSGPAIVPNDPDNSILIQVQSQTGHPGQLTISELNQVIDWIKAGAPEK